MTGKNYEAWSVKESDYPADEDAKNRMADLVSRAHQIQLAKKEFRQNLGEWLRSNRTAEPDGMPLYTFGVPDVLGISCRLQGV